MDDDKLPNRARELIEAQPATPLDAPRERRAFPVEDVWRESARYLAVRVAVDEDYADDYTTPGQYVTLAPSHFEPRFLVIANAPERSPGTWEFLVDRHTELGESMDPLDSGASLQLSFPEGPGYPIESLSDRDVHCFVTGSGIASIRPVVQYWTGHPERAPRSTTIYYGESFSDDFAYRDEAAEWARHGIEVFRCASSEASASGSFTYVQDAFDAQGPDLSRATVFVAGAEAMKRAVIARLIDRGLDLGRIVTNV